MSSDGLKIDTRRKKILEILDLDGKVLVNALSETLGTTAVTIRTDLTSLERDGYLKRVPGGAVQTVKNYFNIDLHRRNQKNMQYKKAIAAAAALMVKDGETLMMNSGTTTLLTAMELKRHKNLNIVTNSIPVAMELGSHPSFRVILLGGEINTQYSFLYGIDAMAQLGKYKADKAILSIDGIGSDVGLTTHHAEEALIDRLMMERSRQTVIVADHTKLGKESFFNIGSFSGDLKWVTNECVSDQQAAGIESLGIEVIRS
jgi:DeoR/GlpR family transcriptional regulator of sugar metabolism